MQTHQPGIWLAWLPHSRSVLFAARPTRQRATTPSRSLRPNGRLWMIA